jgi:DNA transformation protein
MSASTGFCDYLLDQISDFRGVSLRRMFGGAGLYRDGVMFGLVAEDTFYLKADARNRPDFEAAGMGPFVYEAKDGKQTAMPYFQVPPNVLDDRDQLAAWAKKSHAVAAAQKAAKPAKSAAAKTKVNKASDTKAAKKKTAVNKPAAKKAARRS